MASAYENYQVVDKNLSNTAFTLPLETEPEWYRAKNCTVLAAYWQHLHCNY